MRAEIEYCISNEGSPLPQTRQTVTVHFDAEGLCGKSLEDIEQLIYDAVDAEFGRRVYPHVDRQAVASAAGRIFGEADLACVTSRVKRLAAIPRPTISVEDECGF